MTGKPLQAGLTRLTWPVPAFEITRPRRRRPRGRHPHPARRRAHAGVRAARLDGDRQVAPRQRGRRARLRHGARQHVPPVHPARPRADRRAGRPARVHGLGAADHHRLGRLPGVLDGPRVGGRGDQAAARRAPVDGASRSRRRACASAPTSTARERFMGPETSMEVQAALGSDIALAFDECTPFHVERDYTARSMERTHRWLDRCVAWRGEHAPAGPAALRDRAGRRVRGPARASRRPTWPARAWTASRSAARSARRRSRCARWSAGRCAACPTSAPRHLLGIGDVDDIVHAVGAGIDTFDCATPTRLARHGTALVQDPARRWRLDLTKSAHRTSREPIDADCPCPACREHTRGYLHYLIAVDELTAQAPAHAPQPDLHGAADARPARGDRATGVYAGRGRARCSARSARWMKSRSPSICC